MDFFKSVFSDDPEPPNSEPESQSPKKSPQKNEREDPDMNSPSKKSDSSPNAGSAGGWSFGGLIKTLTVKSESVIETYRRDLKEFGSGLKKEIEVAHGSLESVGHVIDEFGNSVLKGTTQIISQGKDAILSFDHESDSSENNSSNISQKNNAQQSSNSRIYCRFDAQVRVIQADPNTYCEEPEDLDEFDKWKTTFALEEKSEEIESLFEENGAMESIYKSVVPSSVDHESFWFRYFYKVHKLKQAEDLRVNLVKRAISTEEEELSWDVDDEDEEVETNAKEAGGRQPEKIVKNEELRVSSSGVENEMRETSSDDKDSEETAKDKNAGEGYSEASNVEKESKGSLVESTSEQVAEEKDQVEKNVEKSEDGLESKSKEKAALEGNVVKGESSKDSDFSVVSSQQSMPEEEDLGWDEIEDVSSIDDKKVTYSGGPNKPDSQKRLSSAEEEEDLSWDIEDDDELVKA